VERRRRQINTEITEGRRRYTEKREKSEKKFLRKK